MKKLTTKDFTESFQVMKANSAIVIFTLVGVMWSILLLLTLASDFFKLENKGLYWVPMFMFVILLIAFISRLFSSSEKRQSEIESWRKK